MIIRILTFLTTSPPFLLLIIPSGKRRYNIRLWKSFQQCFHCLPFSALVDKKVFCTHGGLSPDLHSMDQIRGIQRPITLPDSGISMLQLGDQSTSLFRLIYYMIAIHLSSDPILSYLLCWWYIGLLTDLVWSCPSDEISGWGESGRGVSYTFGEDEVERFINKFGFQLVCTSGLVMNSNWISGYHMSSCLSLDIYKYLIYEI